MERGLPNLRHGPVNRHPLDVHLEKTAAAGDSAIYREATLLYGLGFADHLKRQRDVIQQSMINYTGTKLPDNLGLEVLTGEIDETDLPDMFEPNGSVAGLEFDPHDVQERRFFK
jgi:hypothetical protein